MLNWTSFSAVRAEYKSVHAPFSPELIEDSDIDICIVEIVRIWRIFMPGPFIRCWHINVKHGVFWLGLVINRVKTSDILEELVKVGMRAWIDGNFKEWLEETFDDILEVINTVMNPVDIIETRHLNKPAVVIRIDVVGNSPASKSIPFI